jgi:hypothetical protein
MVLTDLVDRFWDEILARPSGPLAFRFVLQPLVAVYLASRDGWRDAKNNREPYLWTILHDPQNRRPRLREGMTSTMRLLVVTAAMDLLYQALRLGAVRPMETVFITFILAVIPYLVVRGPAARIGRQLLAHRRPPATANRAKL